MFPEGRLFEFALVGVIALIVVGPKDLPILMRRLGQFVAHMRSMAAEFRASFDELARQSELDELRREVEALRTGQNLHAAVGLGPESGVQDVLDDIHTGLATGAIPAETPAAAAAAATEVSAAVDPSATTASRLPMEIPTPAAPVEEAPAALRAAK